MKRHRFDPISLVTGALFTGAGVAWFVGDISFERHDAPWIWAVGLMVLGVAVLLGALPPRSEDAVGAEPEGDQPE
jgi:hypothetical protein